MLLSPYSHSKECPLEQCTRQKLINKPETFQNTRALVFPIITNFPTNQRHFRKPERRYSPSPTSIITKFQSNQMNLSQTATCIAYERLTNYAALDNFCMQCKCKLRVYNLHVYQSRILTHLCDLPMHLTQPI